MVKARKRPSMDIKNPATTAGFFGKMLFRNFTTNFIEFLRGNHLSLGGGGNGGFFKI